MTLGKEKIIPLLAVTVLFLGIISTIYVNANENDKNLPENIILIYGTEYSIEELFANFENITIDTDDGKKTGLPLEDIISYSGVPCPSCNKYTFLANDNFKQTVLWKDVKTGILAYEKKYNTRVYFPNLAHTFWVYNLIEIEVNNV